MDNKYLLGKKYKAKKLERDLDKDWSVIVSFLFITGVMGLFWAIIWATGKMGV